MATSYGFASTRLDTFIERERGKKRDTNKYILYHFERTPNWIAPAPKCSLVCLFIYYFMQRVIFDCRRNNGMATSIAMYIVQLVRYRLPQFNGILHSMFVYHWIWQSSSKFTRWKCALTRRSDTFIVCDVEWRISPFLISLSPPVILSLSPCLYLPRHVSHLDGWVQRALCTCGKSYTRYGL